MSGDTVVAVRVQDASDAWIDVTTGGTVQGDYGELVVDVNGGWVYTLSASTTDHGPLDDGTNEIFDTFALEVEDSDGDKDGDTLTITVIDDVPVSLDPTHIFAVNDGTVSTTTDLNFIAGADSPGLVVFNEPMYKK